VTNNRLANYFSDNYILLTGGTGLVGRYLMRDLLLRGRRLAVIVRPNKKQCPRTRVEQIMRPIEKRLGLSLPRPVVLQGDVRDENLGLSDQDLDWIKQHCNCMIHSAAILDFHGPARDGEPWLTNVEGTRNVLKICKSVDIRQMHYISTAYVCGDRTDEVKEEELDCGQGFRNDYEQTKFEAEKLVRAAGFEQLTVYRPAVIAGDSETGYTSTYHGLHLYLRLMAMMVPTTEPDKNGIRHTQIRLPMHGDEPRNIVPVDWVSRVFCEIFENPDAHGRTFHIVPKEPTTPKHIVESCYRYFNSTGVQYLGNCPFDVSQDNMFEAKFLEGVSKYQAYDQTDPVFGDENIKRFAGHFECPKICEETIHRYLEYGQRDRWGKKKRTRVELGVVAEDFFPAVCRLAGQFIRSEASGNAHADQIANLETKEVHNLTMGLDIIGPGGGQWTLLANSKHGATIARGLPPGQPPILQMDIQEFERIFGTSGAEAAQSAVEIGNRFVFAVFAKALASRN
jgi:thioester reductase-like protein